MQHDFVNYLSTSFIECAVGRHLFAPILFKIYGLLIGFNHNFIYDLS